MDKLLEQYCPTCDYPLENIIGEKTKIEHLACGELHFECPQCGARLVSRFYIQIVADVVYDNFES